MNDVQISPLAKRLAEENSIDWRKIRGTGPESRVIERDILTYLARIMSGEADLPAEPDKSEPASPLNMPAAVPSNVANFAAASAGLAKEGVDLSALIGGMSAPSNNSFTAMPPLDFGSVNPPAVTMVVPPTPEPAISPLPATSAFSRQSEDPVFEIDLDDLTTDETEIVFESPVEPPAVPAWTAPIAEVPKAAEPAWSMPAPPITPVWAAPEPVAPAIQVPIPEPVVIPAPVFVAPEPVMPAWTAPEPVFVAPEPIAPVFVAPEPIVPAWTAPEPVFVAPAPIFVAPEPVVPTFIAPEPVFAAPPAWTAPEPVIPAWTAPEPLAVPNAPIMLEPVVPVWTAPTFTAPMLEPVKEPLYVAPIIPEPLIPAWTAPVIEPVPEPVMPVWTAPVTPPEPVVPVWAAPPVVVPEPVMPVWGAPVPAWTAPVIPEPVATVPAWTAPVIPEPVAALTTTALSSTGVVSDYFQLFAARRQFNPHALEDIRTQLSASLNKREVTTELFLARAVGRALHLLNLDQFTLARLENHGLQAYQVHGLQHSFLEAMQGVSRAAQGPAQGLLVVDASSLGVDDLVLPHAAGVLALGRDGKLTLSGNLAPLQSTEFLNKIADLLENPAGLVV